MASRPVEPKRKQAAPRDVRPPRPAATATARPASRPQINIIGLGN